MSVECPLLGQQVRIMDPSTPALDGKLGQGRLPLPLAACVSACVLNVSSPRSVSRSQPQDTTQVTVQEWTLSLHRLQWAGIRDFVFACRE